MKEKTLMKPLEPFIAPFFWMLFCASAYIRTGYAHMQLFVSVMGCGMFLFAMPPLKQMLNSKGLIPVALLLVSAIISILTVQNMEIYYILFLCGYIGASYYISIQHNSRNFYKWLLMLTVFYYSIHFLFTGSFATLYNLASENTVTIYLITLYCLYTTEGRKTGRKPSLILAFICCLLGILSNSRAGIVCALIFFLGIIMIRLSETEKGRRLNTCIIVAGFVGALLVFAFNSSRLLNILYGDGRMYAWKVYISKVKTLKDVLLGGSFKGEHSDFFVYFQRNLHNTFLNIHSRYGLIALLSVLWMIFVSTKYCIQEKNWCGVLCLLLYVLRSQTDNTCFIGPMDFLLLPLYFNATLPHSVAKKSEKPKVLFLINTIPQIINVATLCSTTFRTGYDITICLMDSLYQRFDKALEVSPLFNRVLRNTWVESGTKKGKRNFRRVCDLLDYYRIESSCRELEDDYDYIFAAGPNLRNLELYYYLNRRHPAELRYFEEGIAEYHFLAHERPASERLASQLVFGSYYKDSIKGIYVYAPYLALHNNTIPFYNIPVPTGKDAEELNLLIERMFPELPQCPDLSGKIVYLDQPYDVDSPGSYMHKRTDEVVAALRERFGDENICIKLHPRSTPEKYGKDVIYLPQSIPFEVMYDAVPHQDCVLLAVTSSAALNVMLKYGAESHALLLYKIVTPGASGGLFKQLVDGFNLHAVKNGSRQILTPETLDELQQVLKEIQNAAQ